MHDQGVVLDLINDLKGRNITQCRSHDKAAPIKDLCNKWVENQSLVYNPRENITMDEQLLGFRGNCLL